MSDVKMFDDSSMIVQEIAPEIGSKGKGCSKCFLCYPHRGSNNTRLVIEGKIGGNTYYWPIEVCPEDGINRNSRYSFDITIRRKGTTDPDCLIEEAAADIDLEIKRWIEKEDYQVIF